MKTNRTVITRVPVTKQFRPITALAVFFLLSFGNQVLAKDYFVSPVGNDGAAGTLAAPFRTISHAALVMRPGDRCLIRAGIYRETVKPSADDLVFMPYQGEPVTINGCDVVKGPWSTYHGAVLVASAPRRVMQVFLDGKRMNLARYPNQAPDDDMLSYAHWAKTITSTPERSPGVPDVGKGEVVFPDMPDRPANYWIGGTYSGRNGPNPFSAARGEIVGSAGKTLTLSALNYDWRKGKHRANEGGRSWCGTGVGYIINCLNALDAPGEWYWGAGKLYFQMPEGMTPDSSVVEARTRLWGMNLSGRSHIVVDGIRFKAASLYLKGARNCTISNCTILYPGPWTNYDYPTPDDYSVVSERGKPVGMDYGGPDDGSCGVFVSGNGNRISHCYIAHSWGAAVRLEGSDNLIEDSRLEDLDWLGRRIGGIQLLGNRNQVLRCTVRDTGQAGIDGGNRLLGFGKVGHNLVVAGNVISGYALLTSDTGGFYINSQGSKRPVNGIIAWNTISDAGSPIHTSDIYLDNGTSGFTIHHNLVVGDPNTSIGIKLGDTGPQSHILVCNNTVVGPFKVGAIRWIHYRMKKGATPKNKNERIVFRDNLTEGKLSEATESDHNVTNATAKDFVDYARGDFHLAANSVAIDAGVVIPGITGAFSGKAPDAGAYERGEDLGYPRPPAAATCEERPE